MAGDALKSPERQEELEDGLLIGAETLHEGAKGIENDDDQDQPELCRLLNPETPPEEQIEKAKLLRGLIVNVLAKLMKEGVSVEVLKTKPQMLSRLVTAQSLELEEKEQTGLSVFTELIDQTGQVSAQFRSAEFWQGMIDEAGSLCKAPKDFYMNCYEQRPGLTVATTAAVLLGMGFLGYKLFASDKDKAVEAKNDKFWTKGKVVGGVTLATIFAATYFGRDHLKEWLKDSVKGQRIKAIDDGKEDGLAKPPESNEKFKPSNTVLIGDSIAKGLANDLSMNMNTDFIGEQGRSSSEVLENVRDNKNKFKGKEVAVINVGGNDITKNPDRTPEQIAENIKKIVRECKDAGIKKVVVLTRFPYDKRLREKWGSNFDTYKAKSKALRDLLVGMHKKELLEGADLVDLYEPFVNKEGELKEDKMHKKAKLHPYAAYKDALGLIQNRVGKENFVRRISPTEALI